MVLDVFNRFHNKIQPFNMTAVIDIVFLLIIFFLVVCQFIEAENFPVEVPDRCDFAENNTERQFAMTTITVMKSAETKINFAVGSEKIIASSRLNLIDELTGLIDARLKNLPSGEKTVVLRIDKDVCFADAQYALAAIAQSSATGIRLATLKDKRNGPQ